MTLTITDCYNLLKEFNEYAAAIYYKLKQKTLKDSEVENLFYQDSMESIEVSFPKLIAKISLEDLEESDEEIKKTYHKKDCIHTLLEKYKDKHLHLQEIRDIALTDEMANQIVKNDTYHQASNLVYTEKIIVYLEEHDETHTENLKKFRLALEKLKAENDKKLSSNISNYYISTITE